MHADNDTDKNEHEEDLELENDENANNELRIKKQNRKSNFRITSVVDTIKNEDDIEPNTSDDDNTGTKTVTRDNSENEHENPRNRAKNSQGLKNSPDTLTIGTIKEVKSILRMILKMKNYTYQTSSNRLLKI